MRVSDLPRRGKSPAKEAARTPHRGDPCPECNSHDTFVYTDPVDGPELLCGACLNEEVGLDLGPDLDLPTERELDEMFAKLGTVDPFRGSPPPEPFLPFSLLRHFRRSLT